RRRRRHVREEDVHQRAEVAHRKWKLSLLRGAFEFVGEALRLFVHLVDSFLSQFAHRSDTGRAGEYVAVEGAGVKQRSALARIERSHNLGFAAECADWHAPADYLAHH